MHGIVDVGAHATVQVLCGVHDALAAFGGPVLGDVDLSRTPASLHSSRHAACHIVTLMQSMSM